MPRYSINAYSVAIASFDASVQIGLSFALANTVEIGIEDNDGTINLASELGSTKVLIGEDDQGPISAVEFRSISVSELDTELTTMDVAIISRENVADYLLVPVDRATGILLADGTNTSGVATSGESFTLPSLLLVQGEPANNSTPVAVDDTATTNEDNSVIVDLLSNDNDPEGDTLSVISVGTPGNGSVSFTGGNYVYSPNADFSGEDSFTYTLSDGNLTHTATVTVTVNPVNDAPSLSNDETTLNEDITTTLDPLANDTDVDSPLDIVSFSQPENGSLVRGEDNFLIYTPNPNFFGSDGFFYGVFDGEFNAFANYELDVVSVDDAPVVGDDTANTGFNTAVEIDVLANDSDVEGSELTILSIIGTPSGDVTIAEDGKSISYNPETGFSGEDTFGYVVSDGAISSEGSVTLQVGPPPNSAPVAEDDTFTTIEENAIYIDVLANDDDPDGDDLTVTFDLPGNGDLEFDGEGYLYTPGVDFFGQDSVVYTISDGELQDSGVASIFVEAVNDAPVATDGGLTTNEDMATIVPLLNYVFDVDGDELSASPLELPENGELSQTEDGTLYTPAADFFGMDSFTYTVSDGVLTDTGTIFITVAGARDAPVANDDEAITDFRTPVIIDVLENDTDADGDELTLVSVGTPPVGRTELAENGRSIVYYPEEGSIGSVAFTYVMTDGAEEVKGNVSVVVEEPQNLPPIAADDAAETQEDTPIQLDILANDEDPENGELFVAFFDSPANGSFEVLGGGYFYTPNPEFSGMDSFEYTVSDGSFTDIGLVNIQVTAVNDAPVASDDTVDTNEDSAVQIDLASLVSDVDSSDLEITLSEGPANGLAAENGDGTLTYTPSADYNGGDSLTYTVSDGSEMATGSIAITVNPVNDAPIADDDTSATAFETAVSIDVLDNDEDAEGDDLTITAITGAPSGVVEIAADGKSVNYSPAEGFSGDDLFGYVLSDGTAEANASVSVLVAGPENEPPTAMDDRFDAEEDTPLYLDILANDSDPDEDPLVVSLGEPSSGSLVFDGEGYLFTPAENANGDVIVSYSVSDGEFEDSAEVTVSVAPINDAPVANDDTAFTDFDTGVTINVLANDSDVEGDELTVTTTTGAPSGSVVIAADGQSITYTPEPGFSGEDGFGYVTSDGAASASALVTVFVAGATNQPPVAMDDSFEAEEDTPLYLDILANDQDPNGDELTVSLGEPSSGLVAFDGEGYLFTPAPNANGDVTLTYTISDGEFSDDADVTVSVAPINDAPVAADPEPIFVTEEDAPVEVDLVALASDVDDTELGLQSVAAFWAEGALALEETTNGFIFDPGQLRETLNEGETASVTVEFEITDGQSAAPGSASIIVAGVGTQEVDPNDEILMFIGDGENNLLVGTEADEVFMPGSGAYDRMFGGGGADEFVFNGEFANGLGERDVIFDFDTFDDTICLATDDYDVQVVGATGLIMLGEDLIYVRGEGITLEGLTNSIKFACETELV